MNVPSAFLPADGVGQVDVDEFSPSLDETTSQKASLTVGRPSVLVAQSLRLVRQIERLLELLRRQHADGLLVRLVDPLGDGRFLEQAGLAVDELEHFFAILHALRTDRRRQSQLGEAEVRRVRVTSEEERV